MTLTEPVRENRVKTQLPAYARPSSSPGPLATFLGLFSMGLGLTEALAPHGLGRLIGVHHNSLLRAYGLREMAAGIGILSQSDPAPWLWGRVAGDAMDLATLGAAYVEAGDRDRQGILAAAAAVAGVTVLDVICAKAHS